MFDIGYLLLSTRLHAEESHSFRSFIIKVWLWLNFFGNNMLYSEQFFFHACFKWNIPKNIIWISKNTMHQNKKDAKYWSERLLSLSHWINRSLIYVYIITCWWSSSSCLSIHTLPQMHQTSASFPYQKQVLSHQIGEMSAYTNLEYLDVTIFKIESYCKDLGTCLKSRQSASCILQLTHDLPSQLYNYHLKSQISNHALHPNPYSPRT